MKVAADISGWIALISLTAAVGWTIPLVWDAIAKSRFRLRGWLLLGTLIAVFM